MKKNKAYFMVIVGICIVAIGIAGVWARALTAGYSTVAVAQAQQEGEVPENYEFMDGITENGNVDDYYVSLCNEYLQILPDWMLEEFTDDGWTIKVTSEDINAVYLDNQYSLDDGSVNGATVYNSKLIVISDSVNSISVATIHEMGHWFDYITSGNNLSFSSDSEEFLEIYEEEADTFISIFGIANPDKDSRQELCADLFKYYWTDARKLKRKCPRLYSWMESMVSEAGNSD